MYFLLKLKAILLRVERGQTTSRDKDRLISLLTLVFIAGLVVAGIIATLAMVPWVV